jgi:hypothetical protein
MRRPCLLAATSLSGLFVAAFAISALAQASKRPLTPDDWDHWRSISSPVISNDGHWVV